MLPQTGSLAFLGPPEFAGVDLAVQEINEAGGVLGQDVAMSHGDSGDTTTNIASVTVDRLLSEDVDAIIGAASSGVSLTVIDKITGAGVVQFSPANTSTTCRPTPTTACTSAPLRRTSSRAASWLTRSRGRRGDGRRPGPPGPLRRQPEVGVHRLVHRGGWRGRRRAHLRPGRGRLLGRGRPDRGRRPGRHRADRLRGDRQDRRRDVRRRHRPGHRSRSTWSTATCPTAARDGCRPGRSRAPRAPCPAPRRPADFQDRL